MEAERSDLFRRRGGVDPDLSILKLLLVGNRNHQVRITDIQIVARCQAPLDGTIFYAPPAGGGPSIGLGFDLDAEHPVARHYENARLLGPYFVDTTIGLTPDEQQVVTVYSQTRTRYCEYSLNLTVIDGTRTVIQKIDNNGHPFRVTAELGKDRDDKVAGYQVAYAGGVVSPDGNGAFVPVSPSFDSGHPTAQPGK